MRTGLSLATVCWILAVSPACAMAQTELPAGAKAPPVAVAPENNSPQKKLSEMTLVSETDGKTLSVLLAGLDKQVGRSFIVAGDVRVTTGPIKREQAVLSVPVRFRDVSTLDEDLSLKSLRVTKGTPFYRAVFAAEGSPDGFEVWCGRAQTKGFTWIDKLVCLGATQDGSLLAYSTGTDNNAFYTASVSAMPLIIDSQRVAFPHMTPQAAPPAGATTDMAMELVFFDADTHSADFHWRLSRVTGDQTQTVYPDNLNILSGVHARAIEGHYVKVMGHTALVFDYDTAEKRVSYAGYVDLDKEYPPKPETPVDTSQPIAIADTLPYGGQWAYGAMLFDPKSLKRDDSDVGNGHVRFTLRGHFLEKVRLTEDRKDTLGYSFSKGDIFYRMHFVGYYINGKDYGLEGWCGPIHVKLLGMHREAFICFVNQNLRMASGIDYSQNWETLDPDTLTTAAPYGGPIPILPQHEAVTLEPADTRDGFVDIKRDKRGVDITIGFITAEGERVTRSLGSNFVAGGPIVFNMWGKRLTITPTGDQAMTVDVSDDGDGKGLRFVN